MLQLWNWSVTFWYRCPSPVEGMDVKKLAPSDETSGPVAAATEGFGDVGTLPSRRR